MQPPTQLLHSLELGLDPAPDDVAHVAGADIAELGGGLIGQFLLVEEPQYAGG